MSVRAKFKVNGVNLRETQVPNPRVKEKLDAGFSHTEFVEKAKELGLEDYVSVSLPTVILNPVYPGPDASDENKAFWDATPNGELSMSVTNPDAAEFFELGKSYYLTFEPSSDD